MRARGHVVVLLSFLLDLSPQSSYIWGDFWLADLCGDLLVVVEADLTDAATG